MSRRTYPTDLIDTQWSQIAPMIPDASPGGALKRSRARFVFVEHVCAGADYAGKLALWVRRKTNIVIKAVRCSPFMTGFVLLPRHWVVERTFAWLGRNRRLYKDCERLLLSALAGVFIASVIIMTRRLATYCKH